MFDSSRFFTSIEINPTELCNFKCEFCPRATFYPNKNLHMSKETIDLLISQLPEMPNLQGIYLAGRGEPTLHNEFEYLVNSLVEYKSKHHKNLILHLATNGKRLNQYKDVLKKFYVMLSRYDETPDGFVDQFVSRDKTVVYDRRTKFITADGNTGYHNRGGSVVLDITRVDNIAHKKYGLMCEKPFDVVYVNWNGDYNLCCNDWEDIEVLGNIKDQSLGKYISVNAKLKAYQEDLLAGKRDRNPCAACNKKLCNFWVARTKKI